MSNNGRIVTQTMIQCLQRIQSLCGEMFKKKKKSEVGDREGTKVVYIAGVSAVRKYVKLPALLWELGVSCILQFFFFL